MKDLETELDTMLAGLPEAERTAVVEQLKKRILQSYRNGVAVGIEKGTEANQDHERQKLTELKNEKRSAVNAPSRKPYYKPLRS